MTLVLPKDGECASWEKALAARYPLALAEMREPSEPLGTTGCEPLARWGIECRTGWRRVVERMLDGLERAIAAQPPEARYRFRIVQLKEKFGFLVAYLASAPTPEMREVIDHATDESKATCDVCGEPGTLAERRAWYAARCPTHEDWTPRQSLV
jgi:hypothetical protein